MNVAVLPTPTRYPQVEGIAHRLEREDHVEVTSYIVQPDHQFGECPWCENEPVQNAVLVVEWDRHDATSDGTTEVCSDLHCVRKAVDGALLDTDPEGITVWYPIVDVTPLYLGSVAA